MQEMVKTQSWKEQAGVKLLGPHGRTKRAGATLGQNAMEGFS